MMKVVLPDIWASQPFQTLLQTKGCTFEQLELSGFSLHAPLNAIPVLVAQADCVTRGVLATLEGAVLERLAALHAVFGAELQQVVPGTRADTRDLHAFCAPIPVCDVIEGSFTAQRIQGLALACGEIMGLARSHPLAALQARWPMALSHAASIQRSDTAPAACTLRRDWSRDDVTLQAPGQPYAWYFAVREDDLQFRRFDGTMSEPVKRAGFVMSDAVTVLPYDPVRDRVMLVEQFRYGPWLRQAANPWSLEAIAGRIDPFETPQAAALREAQEETGLLLDDSKLLSVGNVYPSPGAITEFLYHYVALCELPDGSEGVSGMAGEAEDIRSHVISFARLMELVHTGEIDNGPLVLTAWWLAAHRAELRA